MYVHENKAKYVHKMGGEVTVSIAVCVQVVKVQGLFSGLRVASESSMTPVGTAWMCGANCQVFELYSNPLGDLCCKGDPLGLMCLCSCPLLLTGAPAISVLPLGQLGLCSCSFSTANVTQCSQLSAPPLDAPPFNVPPPNTHPPAG